MPLPHRNRRHQRSPAVRGTRRNGTYPSKRWRYTLSLPWVTKPARTMSIGAWSAFAGAQQSRVVDLIVSNLFNFCVVIGAVVMFAATDSPVFWLGAALGVAAMIILGWLLRRDISRGRALLATYQGPRLIVLVAVAAAYLARRPGDELWIWAATGLAILADLSEPTVRLLLGKATPVAVQLPGFPEVPRPPFNPTLVALAPFATAGLAYCWQLPEPPAGATC